MDESHTFGSRLADTRRNRGLTQEQLGEAVGMSKQGISAWEVDRTKPSSDQLLILCDRLGISADFLLGRDEKAGA